MNDAKILKKVVANQMQQYVKQIMYHHSSIFAWKTPWTEEPGRLQSMASQRVGHN